MSKFNLFTWMLEKTGLKNFESPVTVSLFGSLVVLFFLFIISVLSWRKLRNTEESIVPDRKLTLSNSMELLVTGILNLIRGILGDKAEKFLPLIGTLFIYILCCNLLGFFPGFISPTTIIVTNLACALIVFVYYNYIGIKENGLKKYLRTFMGPILWLAPFFLVIELISHLIRPISLSLRLYGNITGDHMVVGMFSELVPVIIPIIFILLGIFVAAVQAFIFSILSTVYIALATQHEYK